MSFSFEGIGQVCVTVSNPAQKTEGTLCKFSGNAQISPCGDGDVFHGVIVSSRGTAAAVMVGGFVTLTYAGTAPTVGYSALAAAGDSKVKVLSGSREYLVVAVNTAAKTVTIKL